MGYISDIRKYVGHCPIMVTAAMCIIFDEENKRILFEKRTDNGMWCVPGGALELGETLEHALRREVKEETSLDISHPRLFDVNAGVHMVYPNKDEVYYTDVVYVVTDYKGELRPDHESKELCWFHLDDLPNDILPTQTGYIDLFVQSYRS